LPFAGAGRAGRPPGPRCAAQDSIEKSIPWSASVAENTIWPASRWRSSVISRNELSVTSATRTGPSHGPAMRTMNSSPPACAPPRRSPSRRPPARWERRRQDRPAAEPRAREPIAAARGYGRRSDGEKSGPKPSSGP
jgi:hypothetical protein